MRTRQRLWLDSVQSRAGCLCSSFPGRNGKNFFGVLHFAHVLYDRGNEEGEREEERERRMKRLLLMFSVFLPSQDFLRETIFEKSFGESGAFLDEFDRFSPEFYQVSSPLSSLLSPLSLSPLLILFILLSSPPGPALYLGFFRLCEFW